MPRPALLVIGALRGATINVAFTDYFQNVVRGHVIIRCLERKYDGECVRVRAVYVCR